MNSMKVVCFSNYGGPQNLFEELRAVPLANEDEVLVRILYSSVNAGDHHLLRGEPWFIRLMFGWPKPKINVPGCDFVGRVENAGSRISTFKQGDLVFGDLTSSKFGGFSQYTCAKLDGLIKVPEGLSLQDAAVLPSAGVTALQSLRLGGIEAGMKVLIHGASGGVGSFAVQIAKAYGAHVTAVCSTQKMAAVAKLGADELIDYRTCDFASQNATYDLIHAVNGNLPLSHYRKALSSTGTYVMSGGGNRQLFEVIFKGAMLSRKQGQSFKSCMVQPNNEDLNLLAKWVIEGKLKPLISKEFELSKAHEAMAYLEGRQGVGKILINCS